MTRSAGFVSGSQLSVSAGFVLDSQSGKTCWFRRGQPACQFLLVTSWAASLSRPAGLSRAPPSGQDLRPSVLPTIVTAGSAGLVTAGRPGGSTTFDAQASVARLVPPHDEPASQLNILTKTARAAVLHTDLPCDETVTLTTAETDLDSPSAPRCDNPRGRLQSGMTLRAPITPRVR